MFLTLTMPIKGLLLVFLGIGFSYNVVAKGQDYVFAGQRAGGGGFIPYQQNPNQYINPSELIPFRQSPAGFQHLDHPPAEHGSYLHPDLQTSDLPVHLRQTLPQFGFSSTPRPQAINFPHNPFGQFSYQNPKLVGSPSQISRNQYRDPDFLKPTTLRPNYSHLFSKTRNRDPSQTETFLGEITIENPVDPPPVHFDDFRPSRPYPDKSKDEFDDSLQDNAGNTIGVAGKTTFLNHRTRIVAAEPNESTNKASVNEYFVDTNGEIFTPATTEKTTERKSAKTKKTTTTTTTSKRPKSVDLEPLLEEPLKYNFGTNNDDEVEVIKSSNNSHESVNNSSENIDETNARDGTEYSSEEGYSDEDHEENYIHGNGDEESSPERDGTKNSSGEEGASVEATRQTPVDAAPSSVDLELVTSVVTSKTVVNNTIVPTATPTPTPKSTTGFSAENTTDTWVVVASVQTSRSVSGARYLPSSIVEQDVRVKLLNEEHHQTQYTTLKPARIEESYDELTTEREKEEEEEEEEDEVGEEVTTLPGKLRTSTESLNDILDRVQSDLSSGVLTGGLGNNIAVIKEQGPEKVDMADISTSTTTKPPYPQVNIRKYSPNNRRTTTRRPRPNKTRKPFDVNQPQGDQPKRADDLVSFLPPGYKLNASDERSSKLLEEILKSVKTEEKKSNKTEIIRNETESKFSPAGYKVSSAAASTTESSVFKNTKLDDVSKFLPPGYKPPKTEDKEDKPTTEANILKTTKLDDISKFLPPGYKLPKPEDKPTTEANVFKNTKLDDVSKFLPPGYKPPKPEDKPTTEANVLKTTKLDDISKFLPPGYKLPKPEGKPTTEANILKNTKLDDISKFLPPGYKLPKPEDKPTTEANVFKNTKLDDLSKFLPPGYKVPKYKSSTESSIFKNTKADDIAKFLPPGYNLRKNPTENPPEAATPEGLIARPVDLSAFLPPGFEPPENGTVQPEDVASSTEPTKTSKPSSGVKVVFPSRPGGGTRKSSSRTTHRPQHDEAPRNTPPTIRKGLPSRATTEFTGWPTPSTTPISIEKLLEAAKAASASTTRTVETTVSTSTTTTTTTTTTPKPTTPGICVNECDLAGTIKLIGGVKWVPELLDRNTKEWQVLANEVESQLDYVYSSSSLLNRWYKKIRIDGFSEGSVLVDYLVELNDLGRRVDTQEIKKLFHESLDDALSTLGTSNREAKSLNESIKLEGKLSLGNFVVDPAYTDFLVLPKQVYPTVGYAENDVLLPQWAIAVIVIGLASLLFVIIFGVTVLVNRQKNNKKKAPTPLTEGMLNELNKNHMGGIDNYGAEDLYNMEDVWNERGDQKPPKKRSNGSIHDNSMSNLYDSWRSEWNGYYYNAYYGNPGSSHSGYNGRRRSDYDTNF